MVDGMGPINPDLSPVESGKTYQPAPGKQNISGDAQDKSSFKDYLAKSISEVNQLQQKADEAIQDLTLGKRDDYAGVITAVEKADIAFQTLMKVRGQLIDAYKEFNRMNV